MEPTATTRIVSGGQATPASSVSFGTVPPWSSSRVIVVDLLVEGFQSVGSLGIGVVSSNIPGGPSGTLFFDVSDSPEYDGEPGRTFAGESGEDGGSNVEDVGMRTATESRYVAFMVKAHDKPLDCACAVLKWFFGYAKEA